MNDFLTHAQKKHPSCHPSHVSVLQSDELVSSWSSPSVFRSSHCCCLASYIHNGSRAETHHIDSINCTSLVTAHHRTAMEAMRPCVNCETRPRNRYRELRNKNQKQKKSGPKPPYQNRRTQHSQNQTQSKRRDKNPKQSDRKPQKKNYNHITPKASSIT